MLDRLFLQAKRTAASCSPRLQIVAGACACALASFTVAQLDPTKHNFYPQCFLYKTTGLLCAGCGATRAVYALLHGRVLEALHDNVLLVCALPLIGWSLGKCLVQTWRTNQWARPRLNYQTRAGPILLFALLVTFSLLRNIPVQALDAIRPPGPFHPHLISMVELYVDQQRPLY